MKTYSCLSIIFFLLFLGSCKSVKEKEQMETHIIGDGVTDAAGAMTLALNQHNNLTLEAGKNYLLKQSLKMKAGQTLNLNGSTLLFDFPVGTVGIDIFEVSNVTIKNGTIRRVKKQGEVLQKKAFRSNNAKASVSGIYCNTSNNTFENLRLEGWMTGIRLTNYSATTKRYTSNRSNNHIKDCEFYGNHFGMILKGQRGAILSNIEGDYGARIVGVNEAPPHLIYFSGIKSSDSANENVVVDNVVCKDSHAYLEQYGSCITLSNMKNSTLTNLYVDNCDGGITINHAENLMLENIRMDNMKKSCIKTGKVADNIRIKSLEVTQTAFSKNAIAINGSNFLLEDVTIKQGNNNPNSKHYTLSIRGKNNTVKNISFDSNSDKCNYIILDKTSDDNKIINLKMKGKTVHNKQKVIVDKGKKNTY